MTPTVSHQFRPAEFRITPEGTRPIDNLGANQGFRAIAFRGIPVVSDEKCTANNLYTLNENHLYFYNIPAASQMGYSMKNGFIWTGFRQPRTMIYGLLREILSTLKTWLYAGNRLNSLVPRMATI